MQLHKFLKEPIPGGMGQIARCFIERNKSGTKKLSPIYTVYADHEDGSGRLLICARRLYTKGKVSKRSGSYFAPLARLCLKFVIMKNTRNKLTISQSRARCRAVTTFSQQTWTTCTATVQTEADTT